MKIEDIEELVGLALESWHDTSIVNGLQHPPFSGRRTTTHPLVTVLKDEKWPGHILV